MELADFLKTRRAKISPSQVGLPVRTRRRTPGLRREEVAQLAGIGLSWYTWLEQGRPISVSEQIIESLARALMLDNNERSHLYTLAKQALSPEQVPQKIEVSPIIQHVLDNLILCPAFILDYRWNVIAWNKAACIVFEDYGKLKVPERNMVWRMFKNKSYKELFYDWEYHAKGMIARFRSTCGVYVEDPYLFKFIEDLKQESEDFSLWWSLHNVQDSVEVYKKIRHPIAETLVFEFSSFDIGDNSGLRLIVNTPCPETDTAVKMKSLLGVESY
jgi:transcriptional regulator with XRE-family HTH domain